MWRVVLYPSGCTTCIHLYLHLVLPPGWGCVQFVRVWWVRIFRIQLWIFPIEGWCWCVWFLFSFYRLLVNGYKIHVPIPYIIASRAEGAQQGCIQSCIHLYSMYPPLHAPSMYVAPLWLRAHTRRHQAFPMHLVAAIGSWPSAAVV